MAFTDYPKADIRAHRSTAKLLRIIAALLFFGGLYMESPLIVAVSAVAYGGASDLSMQALRWEIHDVIHPEMNQNSGGGNRD